MAGTARTLTITADDFGLHRSYDEGILEAARAGAIDAASVMVLRSPLRLGELLACEIDVGLHLEADRAGALSPSAARAQIARFAHLAGRPPDYLDGHHHCHARGTVASAVARMATELGIRVRSTDAKDRRMLRELAVLTPDLLVGRYEEGKPVVPAELERPPEAATWIEWMAHPGHPDPRSGSSFDRGRGEDLEALLAFTPPTGMVRASWPGAAD